MEIFNKKNKVVLNYKMSILIILVLSIYFLNPNSQFNIICSTLLLFFLIVLFFQFSKKIILTETEIFIHYFNKPFFNLKKIKTNRIKFIWFKLDNLRFLSLPTISFFSFQFPFFFDLQINSIEEVAKIVSKLKQQNSSKIKASKNNLNQLSKLIIEDKNVL